MTTKTPPHWDLSNVYPSLASPKFTADVKKLEKRLAELEKFADNTLAKVDETAQSAVLAKTASTLIDQFNDILLTAGTLGAYISILCFH